VSPTVLLVGPYRFFFNSREETRVHVHVATSDGTAKFWLDPIVALDSYNNVRTAQLATIEELVREREHEFRAAWHRHFQQ
jgi:hypothetical protein